jgi:hypothetical protein
MCSLLKRNVSAVVRHIAAALTLVIGPGSIATAQEDAPAPAWRYVLLNGSYLLDDCPICGRPTIQEPMHGTFDLRLLESTPLGPRFSVENIDFAAGTTRSYTVSGSGSFEMGSGVALVQGMSLEVEIDDGTGKKPCEFKNDPSPASRTFPMMDITVEQTNGTLIQTYTLRLAAAPVRDVWFSTTSFFTAGTGVDASKAILGGDLLSVWGRVVKRNADFYTSVGATPPGPDLGLDAVDVLPGGEIAFSLDSGFPMTRVGPIYHGDLLSTKGRVIHRNQELLAAFGIQPPAPDVGLDAVHVLDSGEILFSIETDIFSENLGTVLRRGDLLSSAGKIVFTRQQLLQKFHPSSASTDYGLDTFYQWPGGEIWFSTELAFTDTQLGPIAAGDLLSDRGYIVFRNSELLAAFAPVQASPDFGLDALFIVTDATAPPGSAQSNIAFNSATQDITITWQSPARIFQVERSADLTGPFEPVSPVIPDLLWKDPAALTARPRAFYRLHLW